MTVLSNHGTTADGGEVRLEGDVPVASLPRGQGEAFHGAHVDVGGQEVAAAFRAVAHDLVEEEAGVDALAL